MQASLQFNLFRSIFQKTVPEFNCQELTQDWTILADMNSAKTTRKFSAKTTEFKL